MTGCEYLSGYGVAVAVGAAVGVVGLRVARGVAGVFVPLARTVCVPLSATVVVSVGDASTVAVSGGVAVTTTVMITGDGVGAGVGRVAVPHPTAMAESINPLARIGIENLFNFPPTHSRYDRQSES